MSKKQRAFADLLREEGLEFEEEARGLPGTPDIFFREKNLAVFFHGCYWHDHGCSSSISNTIVASKRAGQALKDRAQQRELLSRGINYLIVWECEYDRSATDQVKMVVNRLHFI